MEMWLATASVLLLPLVGWLLWWWNERWYALPVKARCSSLNTKLPPGHLGFPLFGELLTFLWYFRVIRRPEDFINSKKHKYGDNVGVYRTFIYGSPSIIACSPSTCKYVLNSSDKFQMQWPTAEAQGSNSIISLQGEHHYTVKSFVISAINRPDSLARITQQLQPSIVAALKSWSNMGKIKTISQVKKVMLQNMAKYVATNIEASVQLDHLEKLFFAIHYGFRAQPWNFPGTAYRYAIKCRREIMKILMVELEKRKKKMDATGETTNIDLMDGLMRLKDKEGRHLSDAEVVDNVLSTIHIGHVGIAYAVTWSLYFLAKNPHVLQKLREENMSLIREKNGAFVTYDDILKLKYTHKVVDETIRIANMSGFVFRKATEDIEFKGYLIPKGWNVICWLRHLHMDPSHFENPTVFDPDRWDTRPRHGTYLPFGGGIRSCPGNTLSRISTIIFIHYLSIGYRWELLNPNAKINYLSHPMLADGLEISISKV